MFCKNCGAELKDGAKFCGKCGYNFETGRMANGDSIKTNSIKKYGKIVGAILVVLLVVFGIKNIFFNADRTTHTTSEVKSKKVKGKPKDYFYIYFDEEKDTMHLTSEKRDGSIIIDIDVEKNKINVGTGKRELTFDKNLGKEEILKKYEQFMKDMGGKELTLGDVLFKIHTVKVNLDDYSKTLDYKDIYFDKYKKTDVFKHRVDKENKEISELNAKKKSWEIGYASYLCPYNDERDVILKTGLIPFTMFMFDNDIHKSVDFGGSGGIIVIDDVLNLNSTSFMFAGIGCEKIINLDNVCMQNVEEAAFMFKDIPVESLDVRSFDMSNVKNTMGMFCNCYNLKTLDISNWNMRKNKNMSYMFDNCSGLIDLDVSKWNTSKVTNMEYMFAGCEKMIRFDVNNWDTSKVTNMKGMFARCNSLLLLDVSSWDVSNVENMDYMFNNCHLLEAVDMVKWKTKKLKSAIDIINGSEKLVDFNFSKIKTK